MQMYYDVVVYGGTSAGAAAAVQAARMGKKVVLIEPGERLGGMMSSGLTASDVANYLVIGGIAKQFFQRVYQYYQSQAAWVRETQETYMDRVKKRVWGGGDELLQMRWVFEPHVAEHIFKQMVDEAGVIVMFREQLDLNYGVIKIGNRIHSIRMESGVAFAASVFIDATYEGDLMAAAGVSYTIGREANRQYGETLNGIRRRSLGTAVDPYVRIGDASSGLLPGIEKVKKGKNGDGDHRVQAYTFRLTLTDQKDNQIPIEKPEHYNPLLYELLARRYLHPKKRSFMPDQLITFTPMPNGKTDTNGIDFVGASNHWPEGNYEAREHLWHLHRNYVQGLLWFLGNDPRVPEQARMEMSRWGLAADEYENNGNWPPQLYVREARRMISDTVMNEHHIRGNMTVQDSVGMGSYAIDCHAVTYYAGDDGFVGVDGELMTSVKPYPISLRSIIPKESECNNLVVPTALSSTHVAFSSIRMEPTFMILAQAAGTIAALASDEQMPVQHLPYSKVRSRLVQDGQVLEFDLSSWNDFYARYLFDQHVIDSLEHWHYSNDQPLSTAYFKSFIIRAANKFRPASDVLEALRTLHDEGIQPSRKEHWLQVLMHEDEIPRVAANQLMRDIARRLANFEKYSLIQL